MNVYENEIAVTLFNLREYCKTESELANTLEILRKIGYKNIQVSAVALEPAVIRKQLDAFEMRCCATHEGFDTFFGDPAALADKLDILGCDFAALGAPLPMYRTQIGILELADKFNKQAEKMAAYGKMLAYHNHHFEFDRMNEKQVILDSFYSHTDPALVKAELDVQWVARGGANPAKWIRKLAGRIHLIHFKDFTICNGNPVLCEVGEGNLEWDEIMAACRETGVKLFTVEQDEPFPGRSIFDSMKISYQNMRNMGLR